VRFALVDRLMPLMFVILNFAASTSSCSKTFKPCQTPSTEVAVWLGQNGTGGPLCGKNGENLTHGSSPLLVTSVRHDKMR
jgi:hypothetical protein